MILPLFLAILFELSKFSLSNAECRTVTFLPDEKQDHALLYHVMVNLTVGVEGLCKVQCYMHNDCKSYNIGLLSDSGTMICQLNNADRYQYPSDFKTKKGFSYKGLENKCNNVTCPPNETCQSGFGRHGYRCVKEIVHKIKVNTKPVCIGAKNNSFGVFYSPVNGAVKLFQMVHISGGVSWGGAEKWRGKWGDLYDKHIELHITDSNNKRLAPPANYTMAKSRYLRYDLPGQSYDADNITLPEFNPRLMVTKNEEFRIWYGEDLLNVSEHDNHGTTCKDVYMVYRKV